MRIHYNKLIDAIPTTKPNTAAATTIFFEDQMEN